MKLYYLYTIYIAKKNKKRFANTFYKLDTNKSTTKPALKFISYVYIRML